MWSGTAVDVRRQTLEGFLYHTKGVGFPEDSRAERGASLLKQWFSNFYED